jgi:hypothetical protein
MDPEGSLPYSQQPVTSPYPESCQSPPPNRFFEGQCSCYPPIYAQAFEVVSFPQISPLNPISTSYLPHTRHVFHESHSWFHQPDNVWWGVQSMNLHTVQLPLIPSAPYSRTPSARSIMTTTCEACVVLKLERRRTLSRVREGIARYHFVFESFWYVRMIFLNIFLPKYNLLFFIYRLRRPKMVR